MADLVAKRIPLVALVNPCLYGVLSVPELNRENKAVAELQSAMSEDALIANIDVDKDSFLAI